MDACLAFAYVLNSETTKKYVGSRSLAQETQVSLPWSLFAFDSFLWFALDTAGVSMYFSLTKKLPINY